MRAVTKRSKYSYLIRRQESRYVLILYSRKHLPPIDTRLLGSFTFFNPLLLRNASRPISITSSGIVISFKEPEQPLIAFPVYFFIILPASVSIIESDIYKIKPSFFIRGSSLVMVICYIC